jgi:uncharacterized LabA/DUF88 family protein
VGELMSKTRIFVDFWNFQLSWNQHMTNSNRVDWKKISPWLIREAEKILDTSLTFDGTRVYISYNLRSTMDKRLRGWANNTLGRFPGIKIIEKERKRKGPPRCQSCHNEIDNCPNCGVPLDRTIEKGIDSAIVTDLLSQAWDGIWEIAILVTSDRDFIPAVELLSEKGFRVINANFPPLGADLAKNCWANISILDGLNDIKM